VIAHLVLFRPRAALSNADRERFVQALEQALNGIPAITRAHVGRRIALGRRYDAQDAEAYPFAAILEFRSREDLVAYLDHPAHRALGEQFYTASESALALDFDMLEPGQVDSLLTSAR
jgi:hypothetical protein